MFFLLLNKKQSKFATLKHIAEAIHSAFLT